jgi:hypothetical protein
MSALPALGYQVSAGLDSRLFIRLLTASGLFLGAIVGRANKIIGSPVHALGLVGNSSSMFGLPPKSIRIFWDLKSPRSRSDSCWL